MAADDVEMATKRAGFMHAEVEAYYSNYHTRRYLHHHVILISRIVSE